MRRIHATVGRSGRRARVTAGRRLHERRHPRSEGVQSSAGAEKEQLTLAYETDPYGWDPSNQPGYQNWQAEAVWDNLAFCGADG